MKRLALCALLLALLFCSSAQGEGWIVDDSLDSGDPGLTAKENASVLTLSFVGDCSIGGLPASRGKKDTYTAVIDEKGEEWPFSLVRSLLEEDDLTFANNEVVFTESTDYKDKHTVLGAPPRYARVYLHSGIDVFNTVNNHSLDYYAKGYSDTLKTLDDLGIAHFGSLYPDTKNQREQLGIYQVKGVKIGACGFSYPQEQDTPIIAARIKQLREAGCQLVLVSMHWGRELLDTPKNWQVSMARKLIDAGADVIWGHHPHILEQVQFYKRCPIFYSTGNFTFGAMQQVDPDTGIFQLRYELRSGKPVLTVFSVVPCRTQGKGDFRPKILTDPDEKEAMLKKLIYPRKVEGMVNLPADFVKTGVYQVK